jgi:putative hemolysin
MNNGFVFLIILGGCVLIRCAPLPASTRVPDPETKNSALANPASKYCEEQGGRLEIRMAADGSQTGYCIFPDGSECEEWAYLRGECLPGSSKMPESVIEKTPLPTETHELPLEGAAIANPASKFCEDHGGRVELRTQSDGSQAGYCIFPDNSECEEWAYLRGECAPVDLSSIFTRVITKILNKPNDYVDQEVTVIGYYRGWDLLGEAGYPPPVTRSDWVIKDNSGAFYISAQAGVEVPFNPSGKEDSNKVIKVIGVVKLTASGKPYLSLKSIEEIKTP